MASNPPIEPKQNGSGEANADRVDAQTTPAPPDDPELDEGAGGDPLIQGP